MGGSSRRAHPTTHVGLLLLVVFAAALAVTTLTCVDAGVTSAYRRQLLASVDMPLDSNVFRVPPGRNAPQQVHITQGDLEGSAVIVSWTTADEPGSSKVLYGTSKDKLNKSAKGSYTRYQFYNYTSGYIHHCVLKDLMYDTTYYYTVGVGQTERQFWFKSPPKVGPDVPYTFGLIGKPNLHIHGKLEYINSCTINVDTKRDLNTYKVFRAPYGCDLGQTYDSNITLSHYDSNSNSGALLFVGDLSYADDYPFHDNVRWDTWSRFIERSAAYQPWIWTVGNHEIDFAPEIGETEPFKPFLHRFPTPYKASNSTAPFWYSIKRASAHIIVLASYSAYGKYTLQYQWLQTELAKVNRTVTPWLIVLMHSPWYNSYNYHYMEGETMRVQFESWFVQYKVDVVFAGHVHAYERSHRISNIAYNITNAKCTPVSDQSAPVYITIGDGGNIEGLANNMTEPQPSYSAFREASFGHAIFEIKNKTHAYYSWHRNQDGNAVAADTMWFTNRYWNPTDDSK
uniref:Purple acid phosphatase n=1 Tax=Ananas comosus var. bracteatus TaxID=296719 RepID=A0A6V7QF35_ANACO|nr:unnamed protein product [Ananas comosus var. bracteatus]